MGTVEQMSTLEPINIGIYGANEHFGTDGHWGNSSSIFYLMVIDGKWAFGGNGHQEK